MPIMMANFLCQFTMFELLFQKTRENICSDNPSSPIIKAFYVQFKILLFNKFYGNEKFRLAWTMSDMDYVRDGNIQGRSMLFLKVNCPCILPSLT